MDAFQTKIQADEKFTAEEVTEDLRAAAEVYLYAYDGNFQYLLDMKATASERRLSDGMVKGILNCMLVAMKQNAQGKLEPGMYVVEGEIYKVQQSRETKNLYAKHLVVVSGNRLNDATEAIEHFDFEYAPGAIKMLKAENRMTIEEAQAFGIRYGICCVCGKFLKDAKSVSLGIGPVCRKGV